MEYAIIKLGNKQHRVRHGETLVVDRLPADEGKSFEPVVLLGEVTVTATVLAHERGPKILIGKYRKRTGYKRHNGFRAATSRVEISLGGAPAKAAPSRPAKAVASPTRESDVADLPSPELEAVPVEPAAQAVQVEAVETEAVKTEPVETGAVETGPVETEAVSAAAAGLPEGFEGMTVAQVAAAAKGWTRAEIEAALAHEQTHAARKGALAALEAALAKADS
jgi:large subunit ribosomal protein L21